ncbi:MAG: hypothetical protein HQL23_05965 [Candidatus Omnitrophica bacterium]|nr:hypothetical protein [Candidatus Omnitrophota bacterium]
MTRLIFNSHMFVSAGGQFCRVDKEKLGDILPESARALISVVEIEVCQLPAPEDSPERIDHMLSEGFAQQFSDEYVIQYERIAANLFQVVGVKKEILRDIYANVGFSRVAAVVPYGLTVRSLLKRREAINDQEIVLYLDSLGDEIYLTFFWGNIFTKTRRLPDQDPCSLSVEITRTAKSYFAWHKNFAPQNQPLRYVTASRELAEILIREHLAARENVVVLSAENYAADEVLGTQFSMHFCLPEQVLKMQQEKAWRGRLIAGFWSAGILLAAITANLLFRLGLSATANRLAAAEKNRDRRVTVLREVTAAKYRGAIQAANRCSYGITYLKICEILPPSYAVSALRWEKQSQGLLWEVDLKLRTEGGESFDDIPLDAFAETQIENIFIGDRPGKRLRFMARSGA